MKFKKSTISAIILLVALATIIGLSGLSYLIPSEAPEKQNQPAVEPAMEKFFLTTEDNIKIAVNFYPVENPAGWVILIHMMPATKKSWQRLAEDFQKFGYESVAIDLRGHGESDGGPNGYKNFSDAEHQKSSLDLEAAADYLVENRGVAPDKISFIGASIGANLSLQYISEHPEIKTAILLSPGLNYHGIKTEPLVKNLKAGQKVLFVSSKDDGQDADENQKLYNLAPEGIQKKIQIYETGGHGTNILEGQPELENLIIDFIPSP